ncbi:hypothetical protein LOAG_04641 [Loa loa]|uniref:Uncharacterized protein n=1 Tax=Loa loa TaxID=7209 RepID=A0A1S0U3D0_LOALO|nr:hypothetical protein LOAG_04641 [Loa loa]EFO23836.2 hypothetical protein LOAG_04641 [Loa loa]
MPGKKDWQIYVKIQAELRCAVFLAIESNNDNELEAEMDESKLDQRFGYSMIYHFLRQNRFLATAAVFEKEIHQKIISLEELKKEDAAKLCLQFLGDSISISNLTLTGNERNMNEIHSTRNGSNETSKTDSNFISFLEENDNKKSDVKAIERQQISNSESRTLKNFTSESELSIDENGTSDKRKKRRNEKITQNGRSFEKSNNDDKAEKDKKGSNSSSELSTISEQPQQQQIPKTFLVSKDQQQPTKYNTSLSSSHPRKLPPIKPLANESAQSTTLPSIPSLNDSSNQTRTVPFSRLLDTILNSPSSNKNETDEEIVEEIILDDLLQSDNNSDATISF